MFVRWRWSWIRLYYIIITWSNLLYQVFFYITCMLHLCLAAFRLKMLIKVVMTFFGHLACFFRLFFQGSSAPNKQKNQTWRAWAGQGSIDIDSIHLCLRLGSSFIRDRQGLFNITTGWRQYANEIEQATLRNQKRIHQIGMRPIFFSMMLVDKYVRQLEMNNWLYLEILVQKNIN